MNKISFSLGQAYSLNNIIVLLYQLSQYDYYILCITKELFNYLFILCVISSIYICYDLINPRDKEIIIMIFSPLHEEKRGTFILLYSIVRLSFQSFHSFKEYIERVPYVLRYIITKTLKCQILNM